MKQQGLFGKYIIAKADGSEVDPAARYFVLRLDTDTHARRAALLYAELTGNRQLFEDLAAITEVKDDE